MITLEENQSKADEQAAWCLIEQTSGRTFPMNKRLITFGKSSQCDIQVTENGAPDRMGHFLWTTGGYRLHIIADERFCAIDGKKCSKNFQLNMACDLRFGDKLFRFQPTGQKIPDELDMTIQHRPERELISIIGNLLSGVTSDIHQPLITGIAKILRCDAARLVIEKDGERSTIAAFPENSRSSRFSNRVIDWAKDAGHTILSHDEDWGNSIKEMENSLITNFVGSVLCSPLFDDNSIAGYIYLDRLRNNGGFSHKDWEFLEFSRPVFIKLLQSIQEKEEQKRIITRLQDSLSEKVSNFIFSSKIMEEVLQLSLRVAQTDMPVLIQGETGTGKELLARFIHNHSPRKSKPFIAVNCGAIPENLVESELFGHEKGAFTGADTTKTGFFEAASGGTLFLDEIGELPQAAQVKLLRTLQEMTITRLGSTKSFSIDVRIIAATNRNLSQEAQSGNFRQDLFYRLNVMQLELPPLRKRGDDVLLLAEYFLSKHCRRNGMENKVLMASAKKRLLSHEWPGNVRDLENFIQKCILICPDRRITNSDVANALGMKKASTKREGDSTLKQVRQEAESNAIREGLERTNGNVSLTSKILGVDRTWLIRLMKEYQIEARDFKQ